MSTQSVESVRHPKIYAYTTPAFDGMLKVGYTDRDVSVRIQEQLNPTKKPINTPHTLVLSESAFTNDGRPFMDHDVHRELTRAGITRINGEWFKCTADNVQAAIAAVRAGERLASLRPLDTFPMRPEQADAVAQTAAYLTEHASETNPPEFLWNAKMRFGKTFATYQLAKRMGWTRILVLTYKPAVGGAWRDDLRDHADFAGWRFKGKDDSASDAAFSPDDAAPLVWFASFQDVLGTTVDDAPKAKNDNLYLIDWDCIVVDEYHFGGWRDGAKAFYADDVSEEEAVHSPDLDQEFHTNLNRAQISTRNRLFLSGTPFRALANGEFAESQIFNWTYGDEQAAKENWHGPGANPYAALPKMSLYTYEMPEALRTVALDNDSEFSLTEFFRAERVGAVSRFTHEADVQKWLDLLRGQSFDNLTEDISSHVRPPMPFETYGLLKALQHTIWFLPSVAACEAMADLLSAPHNVFYHDYQPLIAAGPKAGMGEAAKLPVERAITNGGMAVGQNTKTITLTCGKLLTGVTVQEWTGILMLRELSSPETYFQAAFRVQSPWAGKLLNTEVGGTSTVVYKNDCYVIDFAPNRALQQVVDYALKLSSEAVSDRDSERLVDEFMKFLPVIGFDGSTMTPLDAAHVLSNVYAQGLDFGMVVRRWNSPDLLSFDSATAARILANPELVSALERIEAWRGTAKELSTIVASNSDVKPPKGSPPKSKEEKEADKAATKIREDVKKKMRRFISRLPAFMYLTDKREMSIRDLILHGESEMFERVSGLTVDIFRQLVDAKAFNDSKMDAAVMMFRRFEESSLSYNDQLVMILTDDQPHTGGW